MTPCLVIKILEVWLQNGSNKETCSFYIYVQTHGVGLLLLIPMTSIERAFSAVKIIKSKLRIKMNKTWFNDLMVCYTEQEIFNALDGMLLLNGFKS